MKKLSLISMLCMMSIILFSCGDDDSNENDPLEKFIGTWVSTSINFSNCFDPDDNILVPDGQCNAESCLILTVTANETYTVVVNFDVPAETESGTIIVTSTTLSICEDGFDCQLFTYNFSGNKFTLMGNDDECDLNIEFQKQ